MGYRQVVFEGPRRVAVRPLDVGEAGPGETLVRTRLSGISSGTELLAYLGKLDPTLPLDETLPTGRNATFRYPFPYGYSVVGEVAASRHGLPRGTKVFAFRDHADAFVASQAELIPIDRLAETDATLFPLVETALQVSLEVDLDPGDSALVVGLGVLGLLVSLLLARSGLDVRAIEPRRDRRYVAEALGIRTLTPAEAPRAIELWTKGRGVSRAVEASGSPTALASTVPLLAHEGHAIVASWYGTQPVPLQLGAEFHRRRLTLRSSQVSTIPTALQDSWTIERRRKEALELCHVLPLGRIPTLTMPVDRAAEAFETLASHEEGGPMHIVLDHT
jgi:2-desacetyl-2-hydroxyethyl bacteriochlorophyllide A dehydrogenase